MIDKILLDELKEKEIGDQLWHLTELYRATCAENVQRFVEGVAKVLQFPDLMGRQQAADKPLEAGFEKKGDRIQWHCYICGYYWDGYTLINPEIPDWCAKCKRPGWNDPKNIGAHDPNCPDCIDKARKKLEEVEPLKKIVNLDKDKEA